jgi:hypothetical protein
MTTRIKATGCISKGGWLWPSTLLALSFFTPLSTSAKIPAHDSKASVEQTQRSEATEPAAAALTATVDERVELISIAFRLAGADEFVAAPESVYSHAVDRHFRKFSDHPLIRHIRRLNGELKAKGSEPNGWEVLSLAAHISDPPALAPLVPFGADKNADAWDSRVLLNPELVGLLRQFYRNSEADKFFASQSGYFSQVNASVASRSDKIDMIWLEQFFGIPPTEKYKPVLSLLGVSNLGYIRVNYGNERRDTYTIIAVSEFDANGMPGELSEIDMNRLNLHEVLHTFANQLADNNLGALERPAEELLKRPETWSRVEKSFYNNAPFLMRESFVRAVAIKYAEAHGGGAAGRERDTAVQEKAGFVWMRALLEQLDQYERDRQRYPNLSAFMPSLIKFFEVTAARSPDA